MAFVGGCWLLGSGKTTLLHSQNLKSQTIWVIWGFSFPKASLTLTNSMWFPCRLPNHIHPYSTSKIRWSACYCFSLLAWLCHISCCHRSHSAGKSHLFIMFSFQSTEDGDFLKVFLISLPQTHATCECSERPAAFCSSSHGFIHFNLATVSIGEFPSGNPLKPYRVSMVSMVDPDHYKDWKLSILSRSCLLQEMVFWLFFFLNVFPQPP